MLSTCHAYRIVLYLLPQLYELEKRTNYKNCPYHHLIFSLSRYFLHLTYCIQHSALKYPQNVPISILFSILYTPTIKSYNFIYILIVTSSDRLTIRAENKVYEQNDKFYSEK